MKQQQQQQTPTAVNVSLKTVRSNSASQKGALGSINHGTAPSNVSSSMFYMKSGGGSGSLDLQQTGGTSKAPIIMTSGAVFHSGLLPGQTQVMIPVSSYAQTNNSSSSSSNTISSNSISAGTPTSLGSIKLTAPIHHILGGSKQSSTTTTVNVMKTGKNQILQIHPQPAQSRTASPQLQQGTFIGGNVGGTAVQQQQQQVVVQQQQQQHTSGGGGGTMMINVPASSLTSKAPSVGRFTPSSIGNTANYIVSSASSMAVFASTATLTTTSSTISAATGGGGHKGLSNLYTAAATVGAYDQQTLAETVTKYSGGKSGPSSNNFTNASTGGSTASAKSSAKSIGGGRGRHNSGSQFQLHAPLASSPPVVSQHYVSMEHSMVPPAGVEQQHPTSQQVLVNHTASPPYRYVYTTSSTGTTSSRTPVSQQSGPSPAGDADVNYLNGQSDETATARILQSLSQKSHDTSTGSNAKLYARHHSYEPSSSSSSSSVAGTPSRHRYDSSGSTDGRRMR